ncbi:hypothetical protein E2C01_017164 [Portunus trituberculatus]|uniref:Uncharacterized protein n=1 Tax=Portunus trituberculatus TaxID=210409 RepID=A0A5B7DSV0_PORTR|nr:hypothetical protein [Portunus trituberculatus]
MELEETEEWGRKRNERNEALFGHCEALFGWLRRVSAEKRHLSRGGSRKETGVEKGVPDRGGGSERGGTWHPGVALARCPVYPAFYRHGAGLRWVSLAPPTSNLANTSVPPSPCLSLPLSLPLPRPGSPSMPKYPFPRRSFCRCAQLGPSQGTSKPIKLAEFGDFMFYGKPENRTWISYDK